MTGRSPPTVTNSCLREPNRRRPSSPTHRCVLARYYDPTTGQFLNRDPLLGSTRDAYGYASRSPLNRSDPSGLIDIPGTNWCIDTGDDCDSIKEQHSDGAQQVADLAGGIFNGIALNHGRGVLDNNPLTAGKVNYCDAAYSSGTKIGYGVDVAFGLAVAAPVVGDVVATYAGEKAGRFAAGALVGCGIGSAGAYLEGRNEFPTNGTTADKAIYWGHVAVGHCILAGFALGRMASSG